MLDACLWMLPAFALGLWRTEDAGFKGRLLSPKCNAGIGKLDAGGLMLVSLMLAAGEPDCQLPTERLEPGCWWLPAVALGLCGRRMLETVQNVVSIGFSIRIT